MPADTALLDAACRIVAAQGLAGLTLRPLAQALGVSVTVLGSRAAMMEAVCRAAAAQDATLLEEWRATLAAVGGPLPPAIAADLAVAMLDDLAARQRGLSTLYLEILHACSWDDALRAPFAPWAALRRGLWEAFGRQAGVAPALLACGWWNGYAVAELAYGLVLDGQPSYRLLRRLCLQRLFDGGLAQAAPAGMNGAAADVSAAGAAQAGATPAGATVADAAPGAATAPGAMPPDAALFGLLQQRMQAPAVAPPDSQRLPPWSARAARACGMRLAAQGVSGLTHRAVAADIGVAHTTLSYHYPTQHELVAAGLDSILAHILAAVDAGSLSDLERLRAEDDGKKLDLARASFAVAIAAARMPQLAARTAAMRSRRGANLVKVFQHYLPGVRGIDALCAQAISMGLTGLGNMEPPGAASEASVASAFGAAAQWLGRGPRKA